MKNLRLASLALVTAAAAALVPSQALAFGFGIEGGGTFTKTSGLGSPDNIWTPNGGIIIENNFPIAVLFLDLWADVQTPIQLQTGFQISGTSGSTNAAPKYIPIDLGLRLGLNIGLLQPYVGVLGQAGIVTDGQGVPNLNNPLWGLGGDLGLDIAVFILRFGIELRGIETLNSVESDPMAGNVGSAFEFEALASVRLAF
jgi:hypothetical protein